MFEKSVIPATTTGPRKQRAKMKVLLREAQILLKLSIGKLVLLA